MLTRTQMEMKKDGLTSRYEVGRRVACSRVNLPSHAGKAAANDSSPRGGRVRPPIPEPVSSFSALAALLFEFPNPWAALGKRLSDPSRHEEHPGQWVGGKLGRSGMGMLCFGFRAMGAAGQQEGRTWGNRGRQRRLATLESTRWVPTFSSSSLRSQADRHAIRLFTVTAHSCALTRP